MGVNNLPRVVAHRESNPRPLDHESDTLTTTPPSHQVDDVNKFDPPSVCINNSCGSASTSARSVHPLRLLAGYRNSPKTSRKDEQYSIGNTSTRFNNLLIDQLQPSTNTIGVVRGRLGGPKGSGKNCTIVFAVQKGYT